MIVLDNNDYIQLNIYHLLSHVGLRNHCQTVNTFNVMNETFTVIVKSDKYFRVTNFHGTWKKFVPSKIAHAQFSHLLFRARAQGRKVTNFSAYKFFTTPSLKSIPTLSEVATRSCKDQTNKCNFDNFFKLYFIYGINVINELVQISERYQVPCYVARNKPTFYALSTRK